MPIMKCQALVSMCSSLLWAHLLAMAYEAIEVPSAKEEKEADDSKKIDILYM